MIHRLHYKYLNSYLTVYYQNIQISSYHRDKSIYKQKMDATELTKTKVTVIGTMA